MTPTPSARLADFLRTSRFKQDGAFLTDLDGTVIHEFEGRVVVPNEVELGLRRVREHGRPVIVNTMRFPLSVMNDIGAEWLRIVGGEIPLVSMKGSQIGHVIAASDGTLTFDELDAFPLTAAEIGEVMQGVAGILRHGMELLLFFYPRDWRKGELIWTADPGRVAEIALKYRSAARVFSCELSQLTDMLLEQPVCMVFLLNESPADQLMAYQHTERSSFFTHQGVDKAHGAQAIADRLQVRLADCIGAGDASTDTFLASVGFAVIVGNNELDFKGLHETVRVPGVHALGDLLFQIGASLD